MLLRFASTIVLVPPALAAIWFGTPYFEAMVILAALIGTYEWCRVTLKRRTPENAGRARLGWLALGVIYVALAAASLIVLRADGDFGRSLVIFLFVVVWATDIGAYLVGRAIGGPKLAPAISPNKTWAGALGGLACGAGCAFAAVWLLEAEFSAATVLVSALVLSIASQIGDLLESWWKRVFKVKDSGNLIPGHGGILDRIDGVLLASPVAAAGHWVVQGGGPLWR